MGGALRWCHTKILHMIFLKLHILVDLYDIFLLKKWNHYRWILVFLEKSKNLNLRLRRGGRGVQNSNFGNRTKMPVSSIIFQYTLKVSLKSVCQFSKSSTPPRSPAVKTPSVNQKIVIALARRKCELWSLRDGVRLKMPPGKGGAFFSRRITSRHTHTRSRSP